MKKREFLQLAHKYDSKKSHIYNWYLSEKLDGIRCFWDGGISKNIPANEIPWANVSKDYRLKEEVICTGLWSRYGKVIHAPEWWTNHLPNCPLDGELWCGNESWQKLSSIVKRFDKSQNWENVKFMIIDSPPLKTIFADGIINGINFKKKFKDIIPWIAMKFGNIKIINENIPFQFIYQRLLQANIENKFCYVHRQIEIPCKNPYQFIEEQLTRIVEAGGEGVILRNPGSSYACERSYNILKYKPYNDAEGIVIGYKWGKEGKLIGLMGSMIIDYNGKRFELSGFTDNERKMHYINDWSDASDVGMMYPGETVKNLEIRNPKFPVGSKITFRYRELSDNGMPKEARFLRKYVSL